MAKMLFTIVLSLSLGSQAREEIEHWLGKYSAGVDNIFFEWDDVLTYRHNNIVVPVDARWHVTVPEFYVRHRVSWVRERGVVVVEESHDESEPWVYELRLSDDGARLQKLSPASASDGSDLVVRTFERVKH